jgi:hypothetical protein
VPREATKLPSKAVWTTPEARKLVRAPASYRWQLSCSTDMASGQWEAIAEAADTKMTLHRRFASKDELIAQYLRHFTELARSERPESVDPAEALMLLRTWLSEMADHLNDPDGRGCRFVNAAVELPDKSHPARRVINTRSPTAAGLFDCAERPSSASRPC